MIKLEMKNYNPVLLEQQQKYRHYDPVKSINMHLSLAKKCYP